jgi:predicted phage terminase large subunit-like protein
MEFIDFIEKDWRDLNLDVEKARKWFKKKPTRLDTILSNYPKKVKEAWYKQVFTLTGRSVDMRTSIAEIGKNDPKLAESLEQIWYRYHRETIIGLVKICREDTPSFSHSQNYVPKWFHIVLANELDRAFWNWKEHNKGAFITCSMPAQHAKAQPLDKKVKTPDGWKCIGDIFEGELIDNALGGYSVVNKTYDKGVQPTYKITFEDGRSTECALDHLWEIFNSDFRGGDKRVVDTQELIRLKELKSKQDSLYVRRYKPIVNETKADLPIQPYLLGCNSHKKFIPEIYLKGSLKQRLKLLKGLMDTDGSVHNGNIDFSTANETLAKQFTELVRSVGGVARTSLQFVGGKTYYKVHVKHDNQKIFFSLPRKRSKCQNKHRRSHGKLRIKSIQKVDDKHCRCISVDSEHHLYVTDDYIVTHNSTLYAGGYLPLILGNSPYTQGILCTYSENYASTVLRKDFQETVYTDAYRKLFGKLFKRHFNTQEKKKITQQGYPLPVENSNLLGTIQSGAVLAGGLGQITGNPAEFLLVDDPIRNRAQANSQIEMDTIRGEFFNSAMTRITSSTLVSVIHTRWTSRDIIGCLQEQQKSFTEEEKAEMPDHWHLCLRARHDPMDKFEYDFRQYKNQELWPEKFRSQYIRIFKGSDVAAQALLQQHPLDDHNAIIKREWINKVPLEEFPEKFSKVIVSVDTSCNDNKDSDKFAIGVFGVTGKAEYYLLDLVYDHLSFEEGLKAIKSLILRYNNYTAILVETKSNGHAIVDVMKKQYPNVMEIDATDSKKARVHSIVPVLQSHRVYLPDTEQGLEYIDQLVNFRGEGKREKDDLVDILTQTISYCDPLFREFGEIDDLISVPNPNYTRKTEMWRQLSEKRNTGSYDRPYNKFRKNFKQITNL